MPKLPRKNPVRTSRNRKRLFEEKIDKSDVKKRKIEIKPIVNFKPSKTDMKSLDDLIKIGTEWEVYEETLNKNKEVYIKIKKFRRKYYEILDKNKDYSRLKKIIPELKKLNSMIGMNELKKNIISQILFFIQDLQYKEMMHTVIVGSAGCGKCHQKGTSIIMHDGSIKNVEDIKVGEKLMGDDSTPRNVLSLSSGRETLYNVKQVKGEDYVVNESHILSLRLSYTNRSGSTGKANEFVIVNGEKYRAGEIVDIPVLEYLKLSKSLQAKLKGFKVPIQFPEKKVPFDPYLLGFWLGDGNSCSPGITNQDSEIIKYLKEILPKYMMYLQYSPSQNHYHYKMATTETKNYFWESIKKMNLKNNKHIPNLYKINSRNFRLQLLAGLLDSDGSLTKGNTFDFIQKNKTLSEDVLYLVRSLGFYAKIQECVKSCIYKGKKKEGIYYRMQISGNIDKIPTKIIRKQAKERRQIKNVLNTGIKLEKLDIGDYYGFILDGNHRYLLGDMTVTHNTLVGKILGDIYKNLGILTKGTFRIAQRSDFIGQYLGSTAIKTKKLLESCKGGVLFIDEAYSLGNSEKRDSFSKEAIDTLNQFLSENSKNFICIIAGYEKSLQECFFSWNPGLERRFPWKFNVASYKIEELKDIFNFQVEENGWLLASNNDILLDEFKKNKDLFKNNGGDCLIFFDKCKIHHAKRVFGQDPDMKFILSNEDIKEGMKLFKIFKEYSLNKISLPPMGLYC